MEYNLIIALSFLFVVLLNFTQKADEILVYADSVNYDSKQNLVAKGNVKIISKDEILLSDLVIVNEKDEIIFLPIGSHEIDVTNHLYETIILSLPIRKVHPKVKDGTLENEITIKLRELEPKLEKQSFENDSRWDKLKDLK